MTDNIYVQETVFEVDVTCGDVVVVGTPGVTGERGTIEIGTVTTVAPDQPATVENIGTVSDAILDFEIPRGSDVSVGTVSPTTYSTDAPQISDSGANGDVVLDFTLPRAATVAVGDTDTVGPLSEASVINSGSNGDVVLNFEIPRGSLVSVGTTSTVEYGVPASVTNSGVDGDSILNFSIPSGPISKVTEIRGRTTLDSAVDTVAINISGFTETTDILYVFVNSIYVSQGQDYTVSGANIVRSSGTWAVGTVIDFVCLRSILIPIESLPETIGNTPIPDSGNYFTTDTINGAFQQVGSQLAQKANIAQSAWTAPTLSNGWSVYYSDTVGYFKDTIGNVHLKGRLAPGTSAQIIFTLPTGFRPQQIIRIFTQDGTPSLKSMTIGVDGNVIIWSAPTTYAVLDDIIFSTN